ncbi:MAG TPA: protease modulator HflC [Gammaproteobacteria bacterium]|nr:protease modulator HflC [Gammaproteobacteria bacterium]
MGKILAGVLILLVILVSMSAYTVDVRDKALLFSLGEIKDANLKPGLHFKIPLVNNVIKFDSRILTLDARPERFLTVEKKNVTVDFFVKWRIEDVARYYRATRGQERKAQNRLSQIIKDGLRNEFAKRTIQQVVSGERQEIMSSISTTSKKLAKELGIGVVDVRISQIDLPDEVSGSVYERMRAERARIAKELRAQGQEAAERLRAYADRERTVILATAYKESQVLRGEGDAKAAEIYARAYSADPEFYSFHRSMESYRNSFHNKSDLMVLEPESDFFRYFKNPKGRQ